MYLQEWPFVSIPSAFAAIKEYWLRIWPSNLELTTMTQTKRNLKSVAPAVNSDAQLAADKKQQKRMYYVRVAVCFLSFGFVFPDAFNS